MSWTFSATRQYPGKKATDVDFPLIAHRAEFSLKSRTLTTAHISNGTGHWNVGEDVTIKLEDSDNGLIVTVASRCQNRLQVIDFGFNQDNVERVFMAVDLTLTGKCQNHGLGPKGNEAITTARLWRHTFLMIPLVFAIIGFAATAIEALGMLVGFSAFGGPIDTMVFAAFLGIFMNIFSVFICVKRVSKRRKNRFRLLNEH